jgi:Flp pilus assembly protein TadG
MSKRCGVAVVELAVALPVIFFVVLGTVEVCNGIFLRQSLEVMAFEGARISVTPDAQVGDVEDQVKSIAAARNVQVTSLAISPNNFADQPIGTFIDVTVNGYSASAAGFFSDGNSTASVSMMKNSSSGD